MWMSLEAWLALARSMVPPKTKTFSPKVLIWWKFRLLETPGRPEISFQVLLAWGRLSR